MTPTVIIPCGGAKADRMCPAWQLYTGSYFRGCWNYANSITTRDKVFILSAKHGLIRHNAPIAPYDLRMGMKYAVTVDEVREDAMFFKLIGKPIIGLGGKDYTDVMKEVWPNGTYPITGYPLGIALQYMKRNRGKLPT